MSIDRSLINLQSALGVPQSIVAIPAKNEAARLGTCLSALAAQTDPFGRSLSPGAFGVLIYANNCSDDSADIARRAFSDKPFPIKVVEATLPPENAHAGGARRRAMDLAADWLKECKTPNGVILTTDADSQVSTNWIFANLEAIAEGADAVLGHLAFDEDGDSLPAHLRRRGEMEGAYESLLTKISARLDPQEANPWPHHSTISGASVAVTRRMYLSVGGLPDIPLGEEKAFVAQLRRHDARIRFSPDVSIVTSARLSGRAAGGVADTLRLRGENPAALCDEALEPCAVAFKRALWRGRLRRSGKVRRWRKALGIAPAGEHNAASATFGESWHLIERTSPALTRTRLSPADLPAQIEVAQRLLNRLQKILPPLQDVEPEFWLSAIRDDVDLVPQLTDE
jgi:GT2 family glycosyltransferase